MDLEKYGELLSTPITERESLIKKFTDNLYYFIIDNDFNDGPMVEDLAREFLDAYDTMLAPKAPVEEDVPLTKTFEELGNLFAKASRNGEV